MRTQTIALSVFTAASLAACATAPQNPIYTQNTRYQGTQDTSVTTTQYNAQVQNASALNTLPHGNQTDSNVRQAGYQSTPQTYQQPQQIQAAAPITYAPVNGTGQSYNGTQQFEAIPASSGQSMPSSLPQNLPAPAGIQETSQNLGNTGTPGYYAVNGLSDPNALVNVPASPIANPVQPMQPVAAPLPIPAQVAIAAPAPRAPTALPRPAMPIAQPVPFSGASQPYAQVQVHPQSQPEPQWNQSTVQYTVRPGDTVYSLARNSCVSLAELKQLNGINSEFYIRAGAQITIPNTRCVK